MEALAAEEELVAVRDWVVAGAVRVDRLREARQVLAGVSSVGIHNRMKEACPARKFSARNVKRRWFGNRQIIV